MATVTVANLVQKWTYVTIASIDKDEEYTVSRRLASTSVERAAGNNEQRYQEDWVNRTEVLSKGMGIYTESGHAC